eukprot:477675-Hanusia_phi.AAC.1
MLGVSQHGLEPPRVGDGGSAGRVVDSSGVERQSRADSSEEKQHSRVRLDTGDDLRVGSGSDGLVDEREGRSHRQRRVNLAVRDGSDLQDQLGQRSFSSGCDD